MLKLITTEIDKQDPRYIEYIKTTGNPTWIGYQKYCGDLYQKELNEDLLKYANRNEKLLTDINHLETFIWLQNYINTQPREMWRIQVGNAIFNANLTLNGCYNSLMMELSRNELDVEIIKSILDKITIQKQIL